MKYVSWALWFLSVVMIAGGLTGFFIANGQTVSSASTCAKVLADVCNDLPIVHGISAGGWGLVSLGGIPVAGLAYLCGKKS